MAKIEHLGIAVQSIQEAARLYTEGLGLELERSEALPEQGVKVGFLRVGEAELELLEPLSAESAVGQFIARRGEGLHHLCLEVEDIEAAMMRLKAQGARLLSEVPQAGAGGSRVVFVHPKSASGVLLELSEKKARQE